LPINQYMSREDNEIILDERTVIAQ
jgi:hypothetical protein